MLELQLVLYVIFLIKVRTILLCNVNVFILMYINIRQILISILQILQYGNKIMFCSTVQNKPSTGFAEMFSTLFVCILLFKSFREHTYILVEIQVFKIENENFHK